ncbi:hypothetical protein COU74_00615 [Candidatus Peregrinibacteria bacterium CG10_big_fil_rev_8_21_14_0_10_36_19]|nr:MAG: hypothetical protein COU74_00615 [Candidatus Peregrinibacteria bacterium CG10_big_fil_rev_8_21_14_0_10_36_19]
MRKMYQWWVNLSIFLKFAIFLGIVFSNPINMEGYCVKCRAKCEMAGAEQIEMKNGRPAMKGKCSKCGTGMFKIMSPKDAA